jgi:hypothetical protein
MNEKDIRIMRYLDAKMDDLKGMHLFDTDYTQIARLNLILLALLLQERGYRGIVVTVDRPHQYMAYLMDLHKIPQENVIYIDLILNYSGLELKRERTRFTRGPFEIDLFENMLTKGYSWTGEEADRIDLSAVDFILIDNVSTLMYYNTFRRVSDFIRNFALKVKAIGSLRGIITIDSNHQEHLFKVSRIYSDLVLRVEKDWFFKDVEIPGGDVVGQSG